MDHVADSGHQVMMDYNAVMAKLQKETDFIRLAEGSEGWKLVNEIEALPEIDDVELLAAAKKAEKRL